MRILFFSLFGLPDSCAAATRVMNLAKTLDNGIHELDLLGITDDPEVSLTGTYDGIPYSMLRAGRWYGFRANKRIRHLKKALVAFLSERSEPYDVIVLSNVYYDYSDVFNKYSRKHGASIVINAVEWYERDNERFRGIRGKINFIKNRIALRHTHKKFGNILAISTLLDDYYKERGCNTVTVPTIVDMKEYEGFSTLRKKNTDELRIAYAGSPAKKDYIANAIRAIGLLTEEERLRIRLHFYGPKTSQLYSIGISPEFLEKYKENIVCHGKIPYAEVKTKISEADFTVLLRPDKRYANAGFPTKVGESMACGTPVIANLTSDLDKYIIDGKTGIVCKDESPEACAEAFRRAISLSGEELSAMREAALNMAKRSFDYHNYRDAMSAFLEKRV